MTKLDKNLKNPDRLNLAATLQAGGELFPALQILDENGTVVRPDLIPDLEDEELVALMKQLVYGRTYDQRITTLNRQGQLSNFPPFAGQEASQLITQFALEAGDYLLPTYRDVVPLIKHGLPMWQAFLWYRGHVAGNQYEADFKGLPAQVIIGSQCVQAAGIGLGLKKNGKPNVVLTYIGDGGTSQGDFYEGMNFAGAFAAPVIFLVQNNLYAISVPREIQTKAQTLAQKSLAAGIAGIQVDGMDPLAIYVATKAARDYAVAGNGPVVLETLTFRFGPHTMSDDPTRYRSPDIVEAWQPKDPLIRMRTYLEGKGLWSAAQEELYAEEVKEEIKHALIKSNSVEPQKVSTFLRNMFEVAPQNIAEQIAEFEAKGN
jgi:pyruvate dehydrogenase E1 component alpha subunit